MAAAYVNPKDTRRSPLVGLTANVMGRGSKSLGLTAPGFTHRFFLESQRFELFSRNQKKSNAKTPARKSGVLKALGSVLWAFATSDRARSSIYFPGMLRGGGGGQKSGIFKRGPLGYLARISAKFENFF
jgi:hypothetical protein